VRSPRDRVGTGYCRRSLRTLTFRTPSPAMACRLREALAGSGGAHAGGRAVPPSNGLRTLLDKVKAAALSGTGTVIGQTLVAAVDQVIQTFQLG
jgi:hypothetical protein